LANTLRDGTDQIRSLDWTQSGRSTSSLQCLGIASPGGLLTVREQTAGPFGAISGDQRFHIVGLETLHRPLGNGLMATALRRI